MLLGVEDFTRSPSRDLRPTPYTMPEALPGWLTDYARRGFQLVYYPTRQKGPTGSEAIGWTTRQYKIEDWDGENVGVKLGTEITPGRYLVDIDFDWPGGLVLAKRLLPATGFGFGRAGRITHAFYTVSQPVPSKQFIDVSGRTLVELRCRKVDNSVGLQTMVPPSVHPSGEVLELRSGHDIAHDDELPRHLLLYAIASAFLFHLPEKGFNHVVRMGFAGFLLQCGLLEDEVIRIGEGLAEATGNDLSDVTQVARSTANSLKQGNRVTGRGQLAEALGDDGKKIIARIREWLGGGDFITNDKDQIIANSQENIRRAIKKLDASLSYNEFVERSFIHYDEYSGPIDDTIMTKLWLDVDENFHFRPEITFFERVIFRESHRATFHPVKNYLATLKWDGVPRIDEWLIHYGGAGNSAYTRAVSRIVLIAAVKRIRHPGCEYHEMLILESDQGMLKSSALRALCPNPNWFSDDLPLNIDAKQTIERTHGKWIIEAAELAGMHRSQVEHLKAFLSKSSDGPARLAFDRIPSERPRQYIIIGTTNSHAYLKDSTGNRRFWPVRVKRFDIAGLIKVRDQLWAEANELEAKGESARLDSSLYDAAAVQQDRRKIVDTWVDILSNTFGPDQVHRVLTHEVFELLHIPPSNQDPAAIERLSTVMQTLGFRRMSLRDKYRTVRKGWGRDPEQVPLALRGGLKDDEEEAV